MNLSKTLVKSAATLVMAGAALVVWASSTEEDSLESRLAPVGEVCMAGDECAAAVVVAATSSEPRTGEEVYSTKCFTCHATGAAGAPKYGDASAWGPRFADRGRDGLYTHALNGFNGMPAKGLCMDCSEQEIKNAVDHMLAGSGQ